MHLLCLRTSLRPPHLRQLLQVAPKPKQGAIIGKGGSGIVELETQTGCSLRLSASGVYFHGTSERVMVVSAQDAAAYEAVIPVLVERLNGPPAAYAFSDAAADQSPSSIASVVIMRLVLTNTACSFLIGKGGETIKSLCVVISHYRFITEF